MGTALQGYVGNSDDSEIKDDGVENRAMRNTNQHNNSQMPIWKAFLCIIVFLLVACPLATFFNLIAFYLPWIPGVLIPICVTAYIFLMLAVNKKNDRIRLIKKYLMVIPLLFWFSSFFYAHVSFFISKQPQVRMCFSALFSEARFPFSGIDDIVVDSQGQLYCSSENYSRLQVFDTEGKYIRGWFINNRPLPYQLYIDQDDNVIVVSKSRNEKTFYNSNGKLIRKVKNTNFDEKFPSPYDKHTQVEDSFGNIYKHTPTKVIKCSPQGKETIFLKDTFPLWLLRASHSFIFFFIYLVLVIIAPHRFL